MKETRVDRDDSLSPEVKGKSDSLMYVGGFGVHC
jgi:hypothetical protein